MDFSESLDAETQQQMFDAFAKWADDNLDAQVMDGKVQNTKSAQLAIESQVSRSQVQIVLHFDPVTPPYIVDCIVEFWVANTLSIPQRKQVTMAFCPPTDANDADVTDTMTTLDVIYRVFMASFPLEDELLRNAALAMMRHQVIRRFVKQEELLNTLNFLYESSSNNIVRHALLKRIFLSSLILRSEEFLTGDMKEQFGILLGRCGSLAHDYVMGLQYRVYLSMRSKMNKDKGKNDKDEGGEGAKAKEARK
ncbi:uncharacterized protein EI97DRAFT_438462 [Westerdykella ornata]|uniref:Uncharacterized protein n=1 Tax=Westerdykella ornata TaxID=318751 RepID=A0A6A6JYY3_WESOR|nr:uncharacterized protein EI97DRAFT_438462 [Westerdykella ornata]KAF2281058.1 hypothetical protein EI97DRAFT_438462 [Westerdykella ornata]